MLNTKRVAGTVILHLEDGTKRFLLHNLGNEKKFLSVELSNERTGLACVLQLLKEKAHLDVSTLQLVELTSGGENDQKIPYLFLKCPLMIIHSNCLKLFIGKMRSSLAKRFKHLKLTACLFFKKVGMAR